MVRIVYIISLTDGYVKDQDMTRKSEFSDNLDTDNETDGSPIRSFFYPR